MEYNIGDKVRVRNDLESGIEYGMCCANQKMEQYRGVVKTIENVYYRNRVYDAEIYILEGVDNIWTEEMLELVEEKSTVKVEFEEYIKEEVAKQIKETINKTEREQVGFVGTRTIKIEAVEPVYYFLNDKGDIVQAYNKKRNSDNYRKAIGNMFETKEEANEYKKKMMILQKVKEMSHEFTEEEWKNTDIPKWSIYYNSGVIYTRCVRQSFETSSGSIFFKSKKQAENCLKEIDEEDCKKYVLGIK